MIPFSRCSDGRRKTGRRQSRLPLCLEHLETRVAPSGNTLATAVLLPIPPSGAASATAYLAQPADVELYAVSLNRGDRVTAQVDAQQTARPAKHIARVQRRRGPSGAGRPGGRKRRPHVSGPAGRHVLPGRQFRRQ